MHQPRSSHWIPALVSFVAFASAGCGSQELCQTPLADDEPLCSPALSQAAWPTSHRGPYAQGSSPFPGPTPSQNLLAEHVNLSGPPITLAMSPSYGDAGIAVWGSVLGPSNAVFKLDHESFSIVDIYVPADEEPDPPTIPLGVSGAYSLVDAGSNFILGRSDFVEVFRDSSPGDRFSEIELAKRVFLPPGLFCRSSDLLVGGVMLPDGHLAFATEQATVGVIPSQLSQMDAANVVWLPSENGADCDDPAIPDEDLETVSNSLAADENGAFWMVTDQAVVKLQWDGATLQKLWRAEYASDPPFSVLRLGPGSGSTPSLMGTAHDDDRFVVITDGQELMHLVLLWRDEIPAGWQPIAPGKDPRIACEVPVTFGDPGATRTLSEQSVLVRGHAAVVVNNLLSDESAADIGVPALNTALAALEGGNPAVAPRGVERIDWDAQSRSCRKVWTNTELSLPNAIPSMSSATQLIYAIGQRNGAWGLEAIDFQTGASRSFTPSAQLTCAPEVLDAIAASVLGPFLLPALERLPASCENSFFAATQVGPDGAIYTGTFQGASKFSPAAAAPVSARTQALAGIGQGEELSGRALAALAAQPDRALDAIFRGIVQLEATLAAIDAAEQDRGISRRAAKASSRYVSAARDHFAAAAAGFGDVTVVTDELTAASVDLAAADDALRRISVKKRKKNKRKKRPKSKRKKSKKKS